MLYLLKNSSIVKNVWPCSKWPVWKSCEIKGGSQEMAVMVLVGGKKFNNNNSGEFYADP